MSYHFTKGRYRAYVSTRYYDHNDQQQFVNGDPVEFNADPVEYFTFETNENIKVNVDTLEAPNAELEDEGTYKGLSYKLYDNSLAIVSGTQASVVGENDTTPWATSEYIYAKVVLISGRVFHTAGNCHELQIHDSSFASGATSEYLISNWNSGSYNDYYNVVNIESLDTSNLSDFSSMFAHVRISDSFEGLENLDISNGNDFNEFLFDAQFQTQRRAISLYFDTNRIDPTGTNHKFDRAFSGMICEEDSGEWPYGIFIHVTSVNNKTMFRWIDGMSRNFSYGKLRVFIDNSDYVTPNMPVDSSYMFYGNKNRGIYLSGFVAPDNCDMSHFFENTSAQYIYFKTETGGDESNTTKRATNMTAFCKNNTSLLEVPRSLHRDELLYADEMYYGCSNLGYSSSSYVSTSVSGGGPKVISAKKMFYGALTNWGSSPQLMDVYLTVSGTDDVDCSELLCGAGIGYRGGIELYLTADGNHANNKTVSLRKAFYQTGVRNINVYCNRGSTGENYLVNADLTEFIKDGYVDSRVCIYNVYITAATDAFKNVHDIEAIEFFDENYGSTPRYWSKLANNADVTDMLSGCTSLTQFYSPNNMNDQGSGVSITLPVSMRYYKNGQWYDIWSTTANISLASYSTYSG